MKTLLSSIFLLFVFSCSSTTTRPVQDSEAIKEFIKGTPYTHFSTACWVYDLSGRLSAVEEGDNCVIEPDGTFHRRTKTSLDYTDATGKVLWKFVTPLSHHQNYYSKVSKRFLSIGNEFKKWDGQRTRFDVLLLLDDNGKLLKEFSFYDFFTKHPEVLNYKSPGPTNWFYRQIKIEKEIRELTHTNSFIELTKKDENGNQKVVGYLSNCTAQNRFYIFDPSLTNILKVIDLNDRRTHSVSQIDNDKLLYYRNATPDSMLSSAEVYNLSTDEFTTLYKSNNPYLSGVACGSAQLVSPGKLVLSHSQCISSDNKADYGLAIEFIDLSKKSSFYFQLSKAVPLSNIYLIDGKKFVESRPTF